MRILFYLSDLTVGGCQINAINLALSLKKRGHVLYILSDNGILKERLLKAGIEHIYIDQKVRHFSFRNAIIIARYVKILKIDIVQAFDPIFLIEAYSSRYLHGKSTFGMVTAQRLPVFYLPKFSPTFFVNPSIIDKYLEFYNWKLDCVQLLAERLDLDSYFPINSNSNSSIIPDHSNKKIITLVSRLDLDKLSSINLYINLVNHIFIKDEENEYIFYIAGEGPLKKEISNFIESRGLSKIIFLLGQVTKINELMNNSFAVVAMASTCQQSLAVGKPTFVIGNEGFIQLVDSENFKKMSYYHFNIHEEKTLHAEVYFYKCLSEKLSSKKYLENYFSFATNAAKLFSSNLGAEKLEKVYESFLFGKKNKINWVYHSLELLHSYTSYLKYLILRKMKCVE